MAEDNRKLIERVLSETDLFPDEFKSWVVRWVQDNPNFSVPEFALPLVEQIHYVGTAGEPAFANSWVNYGAGYEEAGFYKDPFGCVHLSGLIKNGTVGTTAFTLPGGYRPKAQEMFGNIVATAADELGRIDVSATGAVQITTTRNGYVSLSGITFRSFA